MSPVLRGADGAAQEIRRFLAYARNDRERNAMPFDLTPTCLPLTREVAHPLGAPEGERPLYENLNFSTRYIVVQNRGRLVYGVRECIKT